MRFTLSSIDAIFKSSEAESALPISRDFIEKLKSLLLPKDVLPDFSMEEKNGGNKYSNL